ncbi:hypothetical protein T11_11480 [Trichinella zimbabwensis]|uniref:Uncharacterized protein n=1 Tax=Trichinella zimbabwensis TaxID=268475 RepID=A0A0V1DJ99_9BILA|nr:hypothetical protein T11_11480 [Trichinella zimbabwensis]
MRNIFVCRWPGSRPGKAAGPGKLRKTTFKNF